jgi:predicted nucleotidyltransferase
MLALIEEHRAEIEALCRKHGVKRLELFGSAARGDFKPGESDVDFFYEFEKEGWEGAADHFFGLMEDLSALLKHSVDLVSAKDVKNPYFLEVANRHRVTLYAA